MSEEKIKKSAGTGKELSRHAKSGTAIYVGTIVILVIVIVAFVLVPAIVPSAVGSVGNDISFGAWDKKPITYTADSYFYQMREMYQRYGSMYGLNSDFEVWQQAYQQTVMRTAALGEMKKAGYEPPSGTVDKRVAELPQFQVNGKFSVAAYRNMTNAERLRLWNNMRDDLAAERYSKDTEAVNTSSQEAAFVGNMSRIVRSFKFISIPLSTYPESALLSYAEKNEKLFLTVHLSQLTVSSGEKDAEQILARIKSDELSFEDAVRTHSEDTYKDKGGDAGQRIAHELNNIITDEAERDAVLALTASGLSAPVKVPQGHAIFRAEETPRKLDTSNPAELEKVRSYILQNERGIMEDFLEGRAELFAINVKEAQDLSFDTVALNNGYEVKELGPLPVNYGDVSVFSTLASFSHPELSGVASNEVFWKTAFQTSIEQPSTPVVSGDNIIVLYPTSEEKYAEERSVPGASSGDSQVALGGGEDGAESSDSPAKKSAETFSSYWASNEAYTALRSYIAQNPRHQNRFFTTYMSLFSSF
jgi:hypothetical protein